jgi:hypothetical protein
LIDAGPITGASSQVVRRKLNNASEANTLQAFTLICPKFFRPAGARIVARIPQPTVNTT